MADTRASICCCICIRTTLTHLPSVRSPSPARPQFQFVFKGEDEKNSISVLFARRTTTMPQPPKVGQPVG
jgi:hypothetical protein